MRITAGLVLLLVVAGCENPSPRHVVADPKATADLGTPDWTVTREPASTAKPR